MHSTATARTLRTIAHLLPLYTGLRRVSGLHYDVWVRCRWLVCKRCRARRRELEGDLRDVVGNAAMVDEAR